MADVGISVKLNGIAAAVGDLGKLDTKLSNVATTSGKASKGIDGVASAFRGMRGVIATVGLTAFTAKLVQTADAMTNMRNRVMLVTGSHERAIKVQQQLVEVANRSRTGFESLGQLYGRVGRSAQDLGVSEERLLSVVETVGKAMQVSGASTANTEAAVLQLSQGLQSGVLRGDEFNSVMENGGRLARALADGLNVPIGKLRGLAEAGELTAERVIKALESQARTISKEFTSMEVTVGSSLTVLNNSFADMVDRVNRTTGATDGLSAQILDLSKMMRDPEFVGGVIALAEGFVTLAKNAAWAASVVGNSLKGVAQAHSDLNDYLFGDIIGTAAERGNASASKANEGRNAAAKRGIKGRVDTSMIGPGSSPAGLDLSGLGSGGAGRRAAKDARDQFKDYLDGLRDEYDQLESVQDEMWSQAASLIESARTPLQGYQDEIASVNTLFADGYMTVDQYTQVVDDMNLALANTNQSVLAFETAFDSAFDAAISGGEDFEDTLKSIGKTLATDLFKENIFNPTKDALKTGIGGLLGGGGGKSESPLGALGSEDGQTVTDSFLTRLSGIFGEGDDGFIGSLKTLFAGEEGLIGQLASMFSDAWDWMGNLLTSFLTEMGLMQAWELAERWALAIWEDISRWAVALFEAAAGLFGLETGGELTVTRPTLFVAGEKNKAERVRVSPLSGGQRGETRGGSGGFAGLAGNGGGGATTNVQVFIPPTSVISGLTEGAFARTITKAVRRQAARTV